MVKVHCDRCGHEIREKYFTINICEKSMNPQTANIIGAATSSISSYYSQDSIFSILNSQPTYCENCKKKTEELINSKEGDLA